LIAHKPSLKLGTPDKNYDATLKNSKTSRGFLAQSISDYSKNPLKPNRGFHPPLRLPRSPIEAHELGCLVAEGQIKTIGEKGTATV
jgi:hypothetical protein